MVLARQVQSVAAHLRVGKNVLVAHIRVSGADTRIVFHRADNDCIRRSHTGSEETVDIIGNDYYGGSLRRNKSDSVPGLF